MGFIQSMFGIGTGAGFKASGTNPQDIAASNARVTDSAAQQTQLLQALQGQGGIQNQSNAFSGLQDVASQYQNMANGTGPNPAQAMLNNQTGQNIQQQAALMAGQRGAGANVGLMARQAGQQGGALQQQAVGQGAAMQAQQQLAGLQGLSGARENIANLATQQVGQQMAANQAYSNAALGNQANQLGIQSNINTTNAGIAQANQKSQAGLVGGVLGSVGAGSSSMAHGGAVGYGGGGVITPNAASNVQQPQGPQSSFGKFMQGMGQSSMTQDPGVSMQGGGQGLVQLGKAAYGAGKSLYDKMYPVSNGTVPDAPSAVPATPGMDTEAAGAASTGAEAGEAAAGAAEATEAGESADSLLALLAGGGQVKTVPIEAGYGSKNPDPTTIGGTIGTVMDYLNAKGGMIEDPNGVDVRVSPGEKIIPPNKAQKAAGGKVEAKTVPGKAKVPGDDTKNDTVKTKLAPGTIVVPRTKSKNAKDSAEFVRSVLAKRGKK